MPMRRYLFVFLIAVQSLPAADYRPNADRALRYLTSNLHRLDLGTLAILKTMVRAYDLSVDISAAQNAFMRKAPEKAKIWLADNAEAKPVSETEIRALRGVPWLVAAARYCDLYPLPWNFLLTMRDLERRGGIGMTRALFALRTVEIKGCAHDEAEFAAEKTALVGQIPEIIAHNAVGTALWSECLLALYFTDRRDWVTPDLLSLLQSAQKQNGSWHDSYEDTAKSLWVFLEAIHGAKNSQKILRRLAEGP